MSHSHSPDHHSHQICTLQNRVIAFVFNSHLAYLFASRDDAFRVNVLLRKLFKFLIIFFIGELTDFNMCL